MSIESSKVALVTGCSEPHSLGAALSLDLLRRGFRVFATARRIETLAPLQAKGCDVSFAPRFSNRLSELSEIRFVSFR
jgi:NADP-dependent 3-hydroxy acid dehydrogenase YdfG